MVPWPTSTSLSETPCPCEACKRRRTTESSCTTEPTCSTSYSCNRGKAQPEPRSRKSNGTSYSCNGYEALSKSPQQPRIPKANRTSYSCDQDKDFSKGQSQSRNREASSTSCCCDQDKDFSKGQSQPGNREAIMISNSYDRDKTFSKTQLQPGIWEGNTTDRDIPLSKLQQKYESQEANITSYSYNRDETLSKAKRTLENPEATSYNYDQDINFRKGEQMLGKRGEYNYSYNSTNSSFGIFTFLKETIRILVYFAFLTLCLSAMFICYAAKLGYRFYQSKNRLKILGIIALGILALCVVMFATSRGNNTSKCAMATKSVESTIKSGKHSTNAVRNNQRVKAGQSAEPSNNIYFWSKLKQNGLAEMGPAVVKGPENKARDIMKQHKLYSIPLEMKRPPQLIVYLVDYFLR